MQSGRAAMRHWLLEYEPGQGRRIDPVTGYTGSSDMKRQIRLQFDSRDEAVDYAERHGIAYELLKPGRRKRHLKAYADNFR